MKKFTLFIISIHFCFLTDGQITFEKVFNRNINSYDHAYCVRQCKDKSYIISGETSDENNFFNISLMKTDSIGTLSWTKKFGGRYGHSVQQTFDNGFIIVGNYTYSTDLVITKTDFNSLTEWIKTFKVKGVGYSIIQDNDNNYVVSGYTEVSDGNRDIFLLKLKNNGDSLYLKKYGDKGFDIAYDLKQTKDNGYILVGESQNGYQGEYGLYILKTDHDGNELWSKRYSEGFNASSVFETQDNGFILTGYHYGMLLLKVNNLGVVQWNKTFNGMTCNSVIQANDLDFVSVGLSRNSKFDIVKSDSLGNLLWDKEFSYSNQDNAYGVASCIVKTSDNGYAVVGSTSGEVYFIKTDSEGNVKPVIKQLNGPSNITINDTIEYSVNTTFRKDSITYTWYAKNAKIISGQGNDTVKVLWNLLGTDTLSLTTSNLCGTDKMSKDINIFDCVSPLINPISGNSVVRLVQEEYSTNLIEGTTPITYEWIVEKGKILSGQNSTKIMIEWTELGNASIKVTAKNQCGINASNQSISIIINDIVEQKESDLKIFPNPTKDATFNIDLNNDESEISIYNILGRLIFQRSINQSCQINLSNNPKGIYFINVKQKNNTRRETIIIQ